MSTGVVNDLQFAQAFKELEPYLLRGVKKTTNCKRLGTGSYGSVHELYVQGTLCAAKQLHESLLDPQDVHQGDKIISRFVEECRIMASVRHPNIVQFLGLHFFQNSTHPILVMEKLAMSLDDLLVEAEKKKEMLPLSLKVSILSDTAKGLAYLHNHKPQIIHRDLTSRNVLLTLAMQAKITDLGNALIIKSHTVAKVMTQAPGTAVYMPPEAMQPQPKYDSAIDMFSYGHLALYTLIQEFPGDLLPATFTIDGDPRNILARSEVERREKYMNSLHLMLAKEHQLTQIVTKCLSYAASDRPCALDVLEELEKVSKLLNDDIYRVFEKSSKLDLITMVDSGGNKKDTKGSPIKSTSSTRSSFEVEEGAPEYLELINISPPPTATGIATAAATSATTNAAAMLQRCEQIKTGMPGSLAVSKVKTSTIRRRGRGPVVKTKKENVFMIKNSSDSAGPSLVYFEVPEKPKVVKLADIASVKGYSFFNPSNFSFEIYLKGKDAPMELTATSKDEHDSWVEAITQLTGQPSRNAQKFKSPAMDVPLRRTPSPWKQHEAASASPNSWQVSGDIPVQQNASFEVSPLSQRKLPLVPVSSSIQPSVPPRDLADMIATPSPVDDGYSRIRDVLPTHRKRSSLCLEDITQFCKKHNLSLHHSASDSNLLSPGTSSVAKTLTALPDLAQNKRSLSRDQLVSVVSSSQITEKQRASSVDPLNVFAPDDQGFLQDTKRFYPNRGEKFSLCPEEERSHVQPALTQPRGKLPLRSAVQKASSVDALDAATPDDGYCDIRDFLREDKCFYPRRRRRSSFCLEEEQSRFQRQTDLRPSASNTNLVNTASAGASKIASALKVIARIDSSQMQHLIEMLEQTDNMNLHDNLDDPSSSANVSDDAIPPPHYLIEARNKSLPAALVKSSSADEEYKRRPTQLSLSLNENKFREEMHSQQCGNPTAALNGEAGKKGAEEEREAATPSLVIESTQSAPSPKQQQIKRSDGHLKAPESSNAMRFKLVRWLSETDGTSNTSLLVTEDDPNTCERRPEWAKATTATTPVLSPMPIGDHLSKKELFIERSALQGLEEIGEGQFGKVYKATLIQARSENTTVAVKTISKYKSEHETSDFLHEMRVVMDLMHPNIVHIHGIVDQDSPWLVLQYFPNGDLKSYLTKNERTIEQLIKYMIDIAMGMHYINEHGLVHRDLAARNVMVDNRETCKVADFGLLREIPKDDTIYQATTEMPWPIRWMAPESLDNREFSPATDVWSFGVLLWEMYYPNQRPYADLNNVQVLSKVLSGHRLPIPPNYPPTVTRIMKACWQREPEKRPSFLLISQTLLTS